MGRSVTPKHRVEFTTNGPHIGVGVVLSKVDGRRVQTMIWRGRVSDELLEDWRTSYNASFQPGGHNAHVSSSHRAIPHINWARVVRQSDDHVAAEVTMPMFEVV